MKDICRKFSKTRAKAHKTQQKLLEKNSKLFCLYQVQKTLSNRFQKSVKNLALFTGNKLPALKSAQKTSFTTTTKNQPNIFFSLKNSRQSKKNITKLIDDDGNVHSSKDQILNHIAEFYTKLYTEEPTDTHAQQKLLDSIHLRLPTDVSETLEGELDLDECYEALWQMPSQKSPGTDGLPAEFYTMFWDSLERDLVDIINFSNSQNLLAKSMRSAILTLAFKGKDSSNKNDRLYLKNWRPISLLNVDYKIGAKALANSLQQVLHYVINPDQACNVPGRLIPDNLYLIRDTYEYIFQKQFPIAMISLDQEKSI